VLNKHELNVIYTNIGRGHPFYLDGVLDILRSRHADSVDLHVTDIFKLSHGFAKTSWRFVNWLYHAGSQGGLVGWGYDSIRQARTRSEFGLAEKILARHIRNYLRQSGAPVLVAHPVLVGMACDIVPTYYQHGEIAVPPEAVVSGCAKIYVPLEHSKECFKSEADRGVNIVKTGLCIENGLKSQAESCYRNRLARIRGNDPLTAGFFSSGAEPREHIHRIILASRSMIESCHQALIFCRKDGNLEKMLIKYTSVLKYESDVDPDLISKSLSSGILVAVTHKDRADENRVTAKLFKYLDFIIAPSHERTNWAAGLGLPMFILHPVIGTFAPLNREFLLENGVAIDVESRKLAGQFARRISKLRDSGKLIEMMQNGFDRYSIDGFEKVADDLVQGLEH